MILFKESSILYLMDSQCGINPIGASDIKKGHCIILKSRPCKIADFSHAKTGKHGSMKVRLVGIDVLTKKKYEWFGPGTTVLMEFKLVKKEYPVIVINDDQLTCLDETSKEIFVSIDKESDLYTSLQNDMNSGKQIIVAVLTAPVEATEGKYIDESMVDSYKEDKN